ncbi:MAG: Asp-tRNA(Asn)/Glu-tRNA(Gln) amidotransferase subunit GatB, partial [Lachnospiraceae bacterium]|nr:Asp-tRNA(Asn)/Glu-tRNA(Gln) amidotransferase subunit GatB [Lachnospiraceae bacterium]
GKLLHQSEGRETLVDYNTAGVPLIEIVTSPDMRTAEEVNAFLQKLRLIIQYLGASDCKLNEGSMRVDVNLSVREVGKELGTRTEMKNLNSFRAIGHAIEHEEKRQIGLIENGKEVELETRRWDEEKGNSYSMRSKEDSRDYRYYPDPDLPPIRVDEGMIEAIRASLPEFREDKIRRYKEDYKLPDYDIDIITSNKKFADIFEDTISYNVPPKKVSNWIMGETMRLIRERNLDENNILLDGKKLAYIINAVDDGIINSNTAKLVFEEVLINQIEPKTYIEANNLAQVFDRDTLLSVAKEVISTNEKSVTDYKSGKTKAIGFLVGQTMKKMQGKASPVEVTKILEELLQ